MTIIRTLVKQIGGTLQFSPGDDGRGTRVTVAFGSQLEILPTLLARVDEVIE